MKVSKITNEIVLVTYEDRVKLATTFLRFQEYYENPKFRNKIFTLGVFQDWYARKYGAFTYAEDWCGFNIPSHVLIPFAKGLFDPLTPDEQNFLNAFRHRSDKFYIIGVTEGDKDGALEHEITHGLYYTVLIYQSMVNAYIQQHKDDLKEVFDYVGSKMYHKSVHLDEVNALVTSDCEYLLELGIKVSKKHRTYLSKIRNKALSDKKNKTID
jgi:hypothetical protein